MNFDHVYISHTAFENIGAYEMNTLKKIVMLTAVLSMGGFFASQQAMADGSEPITATASIDASCSLTVGSLDFGLVDTVAHATGTPETAWNMANSASANSDSSVTVSGSNWFTNSGPSSPSPDDVMSVGNTLYDDDDVSGGSTTPLTGTPAPLTIVTPGNNVDTLWTLLVVTDLLPNHIGAVTQPITADFACV